LTSFDANIRLDGRIMDSATGIGAIIGVNIFSFAAPNSNSPSTTFDCVVNNNPTPVNVVDNKNYAYYIVFSAAAGQVLTPDLQIRNVSIRYR